MICRKSHTHLNCWDPLPSHTSCKNTGIVAAPKLPNGAARRAPSTVSPSQSCASRFLRLGRGTPSDDEWKSCSHLGFSSTGKLSRPQTELS
jgi:hypothetical protein